MQSEYQLTLPPQTAESADVTVKPCSLVPGAKLGFVPNMYANMANGPGLLEAYLHGYELFRATSGFTPVEQEVVFPSISRQTHATTAWRPSFVADVMSKVPVTVTDAIRDDKPVPDAKLAALADFSRTIVATRGLPGRQDVEDFPCCGVLRETRAGRRLAVSVKTLSNFSTISSTPRSTRPSPRGFGTRRRWRSKKRDLPPGA